MRCGGFDCRRQDCPKVRGKECPRCGMPETGADVLAIMNLHARCRANKCLPASGGLLDQPAHIMDMFDVIDEVQEKFHMKESERRREAEARAKLAEGIVHGR